EARGLPDHVVDRIADVADEREADERRRQDDEESLRQALDNEASHAVISTPSPACGPYTSPCGRQAGCGEGPRRFSRGGGGGGGCTAVPQRPPPLPIPPPQGGREQQTASLNPPP